jgi:GNAT superfamily N-acetyltransferase
MTEREVYLKLTRFRCDTFLPLMAESIQLRFSDACDTDEITRLINAAFVVERFFIDRDRITFDEVREFIGKGKFMLAEDESGIAACVYLELRGDRGYFGLLSVRPSRQKSGLGRRLVNAGEDYFRNAGCLAVDLQIVNLRTELPAFYQRLGYVENGIAPFAADAEPSMPCHFVRMTKELA